MIDARQSSDKPGIWSPCKTQRDVKELEEDIERAKRKSGSGFLKKSLRKANVEKLEAELKTTKELTKEKCVYEFRAYKANNRSRFDRSMTKVENNPWWEIDLKNPTMLWSIAVFPPEQRAHELNGLIVAVSGTVSGDQLMWDTSGAVRRYKLGPVAVAIVKPVSLNTFHTRRARPGAVRPSQLPTPTRHIRIYRAGRGAVALGEVQVYGSQVR